MVGLSKWPLRMPYILAARLNSDPDELDSVYVHDNSVTEKRTPKIELSLYIFVQPPEGQVGLQLTMSEFF